MAIRNEDELLAFFMSAGCMLDKETRTVYISDVNADGEFFGIMVADELPEDACCNVTEACQYALDERPAPGAFGAAGRMDFMEAPGGWFSELAEEVIAEPNRFMTE